MNTKRFIPIESIDDSDFDIQSIKFEFGEFHANLILKNGFDENSLPHKIIEDMGLMHLFTSK